MKLKYIEDYYDQIRERFPLLDNSDIEKILKRGFQKLYTVCNYGADAHFSSKKFSMSLYFGKYFKPYTEMYWKYVNIKHRIKCRIKYFSKKPVWNGLYYFGLTEEEYQKYIPKDKSGRIKNKIKFTDIWLYKICEEWFNDRKIRYVYSVPIKEEQGLTIHLDELETRNISLVAKRDKQNIMKYIYEKKYD